MKERKLAVRGLILKDKKLFCVKHKNYLALPLTEIPDFWCLPGGGVDDGESLKSALRREMIEETGVPPIIGNLLYIQQFRNKDGSEKMEFFFHISNYKDYVSIDLENTSHGSIEIETIEFVDPQNSYLLPNFLTKQDLDLAVRKGITQIFNYK